LALTCALHRWGPACIQLSPMFHSSHGRCGGDAGSGGKSGNILANGKGSAGGKGGVQFRSFGKGGGGPIWGWEGPKGYPKGGYKGGYVPFWNPGGLTQVSYGSYGGGSTGCGRTGPTYPLKSVATQVSCEGTSGILANKPQRECDRRPLHSPLPMHSSQDGGAVVRKLQSGSVEARDFLHSSRPLHSSQDGGAVVRKLHGGSVEARDVLAVSTEDGVGHPDILGLRTFVRDAAAGGYATCRDGGLGTFAEPRCECDRRPLHSSLPMHSSQDGGAVVRKLQDGSVEARDALHSLRPLHSSQDGGAVARKFHGGSVEEGRDVLGSGGQAAPPQQDGDGDYGLEEMLVRRARNGDLCRLGFSLAAIADCLQDEEVAGLAEVSRWHCVAGVACMMRRGVLGRGIDEEYDSEEDFTADAMSGPEEADSGTDIEGVSEAAVGAEVPGCTFLRGKVLALFKA
jgi:hypothetical protein